MFLTCEKKITCGEKKMMSTVCERSTGENRVQDQMRSALKKRCGRFKYKSWAIFSCKYSDFSSTHAEVDFLGSLFRLAKWKCMPLRLPGFLNNAYDRNYIWGLNNNVCNFLTVHASLNPKYVPMWVFIRDFSVRVTPVEEHLKVLFGLTHKKFEKVSRKIQLLHIKRSLQNS